MWALDSKIKLNVAKRSVSQKSLCMHVVGKGVVGHVGCIEGEKMQRREEKGR